jgi:hypothetical protein
MLELTEIELLIQKPRLWDKGEKAGSLRIGKTDFIETKTAAAELVFTNLVGVGVVYLPNSFALSPLLTESATTRPWRR